MKYLALLAFLPVFAFAQTPEQIDSLKARADKLLFETQEIYRAADRAKYQAEEIQKELKLFTIPEPEPEPEPTPDPDPEPTPEPTGDFAEQIAALAPGAWMQYGVAPSASPVFPKREDLYKNGGTVGPAAIFTAWNGAAYTGDAMVFFGGGHADGSANGLYGLSLTNGEWYQVAPEYPYDLMVDDCAYPSEAPSSSHTYDGIVYAEGSIYVWGTPGYAPRDFCWGNGTWKWDISASKWVKMAFNGGYASAYDGDKIYYHNGKTAWITVDPTDDSFVSKPKNEWHRESMNMIYDEARDLLWMVNNGGTLYIVNKTGGTTKVQSPYTNRELRNMGFDVAPDGNLYFWKGSSLIIVYNPDTGEWSELDGGRPVTETEKIFSKWVYVENLGVFAGISTFYEAPWYWKPPTGEVGGPVVEEPDDEPVDVVDQVIFLNGKNTGLPHYENLGTRPNYTHRIVNPMGNAGDRHDIGLIPDWTAGWLATGDDHFYAAMMDVANIDIPWLPDNPNKTVPWNPEQKWKLSGAHMPNMYWIPYLATGDDKYLQQMKDSWTWYSVGYRGRSDTDGVWHTNTRGIAWMFRTVAELATVDPYYQTALDATLVRLQELQESQSVWRSYWPIVGRTQDECGMCGEQKRVVLWEEAFLTQVLGHAVLLGHENVRPFLEKQITAWKTLFDFNPNILDEYLGPQVKIDNVYLDTEEKFFAAIGERYKTRAWWGKRKDILYADGKNEADDLRARYVLAGFGIAAVAGIPHAQELYDQYSAMVEARQITRWITYKNAVVVPE